MAKFARSEQFKTPTARFSYVQGMFNRVTKTDDDGKPILKDGVPVTEQQCTLIFDNTTDKTLFEKAVHEVIIGQWGEPGLERAKNGLIKLPFLKGDSKEARDKKTGEIRPGLGADKWFIRTATRLEAPVRFRSAHIPAKMGNGDDEVKSGDYGFAVLTAFAWNSKKSGDGVSFGIDYLQKTKAGEPLGGGAAVNVDNVFEQVEDAGEAPASTKSGEGAGGLFETKPADAKGLFA